MYEFPSSAPKSTLFLPYTLRPRPQTSSTARQHLNGQNVLKVGKTTIPFLICGANDLHRLQQRRPSQCRGHRPAEALGKTRFETIFWNAKKKTQDTISRMFRHNLKSLQKTKEMKHLTVLQSIIIFGGRYIQLHVFLSNSK